MIILDTVNRKLRVVLAGAKATLDCPVTVHYVDAPAYTPDSIPIFTNGVTAIDIIPGLASPNTRHIKLITFVNTDTAVVKPIFSYNDAGVIYPITAPLELDIGDTLTYADGIGWRVLDKKGNQKGIGTPGITGTTGATGSAGIGSPGIDGKKGDFGFPGSQGIPGQQGTQGNTGAAGIDGKTILAIDGKPGPFGFPGAPGKDGLVGAQGIQGIPGNDGKTILALDGKKGDMGFSIPGQQGPQGIQGNQGLQGPVGPTLIHLDGKPGVMGFPGNQGLQGNQGIQGIQGIVGAQGLIIPALDGKTGPMGFPFPGPKGDKGDTGATGSGGGGAPSMLMARDGLIGVMGFPGPPGPVDGTKISALSLVTAFLDAMEFPVNDAGTTKKASGTLVKAWVGDSLQNQSTANQTPTAATLTYLTGSNLAVPVGKLRIGTIFIWRISISKSAAGTAANSFHFRLGTAGTTADTALCTFTTGLGTAVADDGWIEVMVTIRGPLSASCIAQGHFHFTHNLSATGHLVIPVADIPITSGTFDATVANFIAGLSVTSGASVAYTIRQVCAEAKNL